MGPEGGKSQLRDLHHLRVLLGKLKARLSPMLRSLLVLACGALAAGFQGAGLPARSVAADRAASSAVVMKHPAYYQRLQKAESGRLRLCVFRSNNHIYGQVIDDSKHAVVCAASTLEEPLKEESGGNKAAASKVGKLLGERAIAKGVEKVHFDRNGKPYHGRIAALADGAREAGLKF